MNLTMLAVISTLIMTKHLIMQPSGMKMNMSNLLLVIIFSLTQFVRPAMQVGVPLGVKICSLHLTRQHSFKVLGR